ncbi:Protein of unknown function (DUF3343) [Desulfitobacterium dichloroeliminans LMG P-21439]|uniref:Putative Se/S carrier protein-like domain-containing protein n=1 Tax=Desulfitobacterium dichloroeliminans (strain LMG P-21439 / DCA1) TaxID=871963 RepID=L0FDI1_DESDL|nr:DUF3343 domain-containing protein [Desulfitobacterium dichloroeliminans]AGA70716.1 Protein of unknown function (DUF3343) [Desulfitobacterium dichloroeliminans LMG P-21439]
MLYIVTFPNTHMAILAEKSLQQGGFSVGIMPIPSSIKAGCGIALRVTDAQAAQGHLLENEIHYGEIYLAITTEKGTTYQQINSDS